MARTRIEKPHNPHGVAEPKGRDESGASHRVSPILNATDAPWLHLGHKKSRRTVLLRPPLSVQYGGSSGSPVALPRKTRGRLTGSPLLFLWPPAAGVTSWRRARTL